jgi:hypothetical protein
MASLKEIITFKLLPKIVDEAIIDMSIDEVTYTVKNILNYRIDEDLPEDVKFTLANITVDLIKRNMGGEVDMGTVKVGGITNIKEGDTSVSFGDATGSKGVVIHGVEAVIDDYLTLLYRFRKLNWGQK